MTTTLCLKNHFATAVMDVWCQPGGQRWLGSRRESLLTQMKDKGEWTAPRKIYYGVVFKKMQFENTQGRGKNNPFFHLLSISLPFLYLSIQQGWERSGVAEKERESGAMSQ